MDGFRGDDGELDCEIETLEGIARTRLRKANRELRDIDRDLRELKRLRARRRAEAAVPAEEALPAEAPVGSR
jgi:predicted polyphosphate/ATP-dependent NAD kinase